jgi:small-conductance mechanosensitive channel/CRP-like cAMP-binding protein
MRRIALPIAVFGIVLTAYLFWYRFVAWLGFDTAAPWVGWAALALASLSWFCAAKLLNRMLHVFVWEGWYARRPELRIPKLLTDIVGVLIWVTAGFLVAAFVFDIEVTGLVTASGLTIAVIGFALRNMIADVFTGIALNIEHPLKIGDWVELDDGTIGGVVEINWRATRLVTKENYTKVVPNSYMATNPFVNFHTPESYFRDQFEIILGYEVTAHQAERILLSAASQIEESARLPRKPFLRIAEYLEHGIKWELRYWVPDYPSRSSIQYRIQRNVLRNLHFAGVTVPRQKLEFADLNHPRSQPDRLSEDVAFLRGIELFDCLETSELEALSERMKRRLCLKDEPVVTQGDTSSVSLFIVKEGYLDVTIGNDKEEAVQVGWLAPGMLFGEMSLLTGVPRSATVTPTVDAVLFEISKSDFAPLLEDSPDLAQRLSNVVADRQMRNDASLAAASAANLDEQKKRLSDRLLSSIVSFFQLSEKKKRA